MKLNDQIHLRGEILIQEIDDNGSISTLVEDKNLIVASGRVNICDSLLGASSSYIYDIKFGNGGTVTGNISSALPVVSTDETLNAPITAVKGADYSFIGVKETSPSPRIVFSIVVPKEKLVGQVDPEHITLLNGKVISELALMLNTTEVAFAIKRFPGISKSDAISLLVTWTIFI